MEWPVALVVLTGMLCVTGCYLVPLWAPIDHSKTERSPAIGFTARLTADEPQDD